MEGIVYQLGNEKSTDKNVTIKMDGKIHRSLFKNKRFVGTIDISGEPLPPSNAVNKELVIELDQDNSGIIQYTANNGEDGYADFHWYGSLFVQDDFSRITIAKYKQTESESGWSSKDGIMITAPATNRVDGLRIANELMKEFLQNPLK